MQVFVSGAQGSSWQSKPRHNQSLFWLSSESPYLFIVLRSASLFNNMTRVLFISSERFPSSISDTAQRILNPPQLPLTSEPILSYKPQVSIQTFLLTWMPWLFKVLPIVAIEIDVNHVGVGFSSKARKREKRVGKREKS